jgi:spectinomycin phosphotransferase
MLDKPDIEDERISAALYDAYGIAVARLTFLPLGADRDAAVYRAGGQDSRQFFVKLRQGAFDETTVVLPRFLGEHGIRHVIAPLLTTTGGLWTRVEPFAIVVFPFIQGHNGMQPPQSDEQWREFGRALRAIHAVQLSPELEQRIARETYSPYWRDMAMRYLQEPADPAVNDAVTVEFFAFLEARHAEIVDLIVRAERNAQELLRRPPRLVLCHSDCHGHNMLIDGSGSFFIVDWDNPILAPKERDLMFAGGAQMGNNRTPEEEEKLFYQGYGETQVDATALAYYRYERIVEDIAVYSDSLLYRDEGPQNRQHAIRSLKSNFLPGNTIEVAYEADRRRSGQA